MLNVHLASVGESCLIGFAENWVEGFAPCVVGIEPADAAGHYELHSQDGVAGLSCCVQVAGVVTRWLAKDLQDRDWAHAPYGEADTCEIELTSDQLAAHLRQQALEGSSVG